LVIVAQAAALVGIVPQPKTGDRQTGAHVSRRTGEVRRVLRGYDLAAVGPVVSEVEGVCKLNGCEGGLRDHLGELPGPR